MPDERIRCRLHVDGSLVDQNVMGFRFRGDTKCQNPIRSCQFFRLLLAVLRRISACGAAGEGARFSHARPFRLSSGGTGATHFVGCDGVDIFRC